jgi:hypothetical protein
MNVNLYEFCTSIFGAGVKRPGREADHSPLRSAEVQNAWSYTSTPQYALWRRAQLKESTGQVYLLLLSFKDVFGIKRY